MAQAAAEGRTAVRTTITRENIPLSTVGAIPADFYNRDFWEVIHSLTAEMWKDHIVRVYRADDRWEKAGAPENNFFVEDFTEEMLRQRFGGGRYKLWLYGPPKRAKLVMSPFQLELEGVAKVGGANSAVGTNGAPAASGDPLLAEVLNELRAQRQTSQDVMRETFRQSMEIMGTAYRNAAAVVSATPGGASAQGSPIVDKLLTIAIERMMNPPDPMAGFTTIGTMLTGMATLAKEFTSTFKPAGTEKASLMGMVVEHLPKLGEHVVGSLHEMRLAEQARAEQAKYGQPRFIDQPPTNTAPPAHVPTSPAEAEANLRAANARQDAPAAPESAAPAPPPVSAQDEATMKQLARVEHLMGRINELICHTMPPASGQDVYDWMAEEAPDILTQLAPLSRDEIILGVFKHWPQLKESAEHERLPQVVDEFLAAAKTARPPKGA